MSTSTRPLCKVPAPPPEGKPVIRVWHVAWLMDLSVAKTEQLVKRGIVPSFKIDGSRCFHRATIEQLIARLASEAH